MLSTQARTAIIATLSLLLVALLNGWTSSRSCTPSVRAWAAFPCQHRLSAELPQRYERTTPNARQNIGVKAFSGTRSTKHAKFVTRRGLKNEELELLRQAAGEGDAESQFLLGKMYLEGEEVEANATRAAFLFERAGQKGIATAQYNLGMMLVSGTGIEQDVSNGFAWLETAAGNGEMLAQYFLGRAYLAGDDVEPDPHKALDYLRKAADQGYLDAQYLVGMMLLNTPEEAVEERRWSAHYLNLAAEQNDPRAQFQVGMLFLKGTAVEPNPETAATWISAAASSGLGCTVSDGHNASRWYWCGSKPTVGRLLV